MSKIILSIAFLMLLISHVKMNGQINMKACSSQFGNGKYDFFHTGTTDDGTIRNTFETIPGDGQQPCNGFGYGFCEFRIIWNSIGSRWEVQISDGFQYFTIYYNNTSSAPNPPDLTLGDWMENTELIGSSCGGDGSFEILTGDVQSYVTLPLELTSVTGE